MAYRLHALLLMHEANEPWSDNPRYVMARPQWSVLDVDLDQEILVHLTVDVRPAHRPSRWAWRLVDGRDGSEFEIGFDYESPSEARQAALDRLAELTTSLPGVTRLPGSDPRSATPLYRKSA